MNLAQAKQKIIQAIRENTGELNLNSIGDTEKLTDADLKVLLPDISRVQDLEILDLSNNGLTKFDKTLAQLNNLSELDLSDNQISSISLELENLMNLQVLDLRGNNLSIPKERLEAYGNPQKIFDFIHFKHLVYRLIKNKDTKLNLSYCELTNADLTELLPDILKIENLQELDLNDNRLTKFDKGFAKLKKLQIINLSNNKLTLFDKEFAELEGLRELYLRSNRLATFDKEFTKLKNLQKLDLKENLLPFPYEILSDNSKTQKILNYISDYYNAKEAGNLKKLNEAKLVIIGESNVGKTCIINRLIDNKFIETDSTHGIQIRRWENVYLRNKERVQMNVWDFGGQEIMHSTHQFFFTKRTVYILVINARENDDTNKTEEWLQRIQNLSQNSPVFIVGNKIDENNRGTDRTSLGYFDIERKRLNEKFPSLIKGFYGVSSDVKQSQFDFLFEDFKKALISEIGKLGEIHKEFPANWFDIKAQLEEMQSNKVPYITFRDYLSRCIKADIENEESQRTLIDFMHDLGIALSFQDDKELRDLAVLNPEWVTRGVYALIDNAQITLEKGILKREDIGKYLNEQAYPKDTQDFIIKMMRKFRLLIDIKNDEVFLIPDLLPKDETDTGSWDDTLHFHYNYEIYEKSILRRFIVEMFYMRSKETYWRRGIVLKRGDNRALVKAEVQDKKISIKIDGNSNTRREFIAIIRNKFAEIHRSFDGLSFKEMLGHPRYPNVLRDYYRLRSMEDDGIEKEYVEELRTSLPVKEWLNGFYSVEERRRKDREKESNNIYIVGDNNRVFQDIKDSQITVQEKIIEEVLQEMDDAHKREIAKLSDEIISRIEKEFAIQGKAKDGLETAKKGKWETKLKFAIPFIPLEFERNIPPEEFISKVRKWFYGGDLQLNLLEAEDEKVGLLGE